MIKQFILRVFCILLVSTLFVNSSDAQTLYAYDFEFGTGGWTTSGANSSWAWGIPNGTLINSAGGGQRAFVTNLSGNYSAFELSYLESPLMNFTGAGTDPRITFSIFYNTENNFDRCWLELSVDSGGTWSKVGTSGTGINWYNDANNDWWDNNSNGWIVADNFLTGSAGMSGVKVRFVFSSDGIIFFEGVGVDEIDITAPIANDVGVIAINSPITGCGLSASEIVSVQVKNFGSLAQSNFPIRYNVNGGPATIEIFTGTIQPGDTLPFTFTTGANLSATGSYTIVAATQLLSDPIAGNNLSFTSVQNLAAINSFAFVEDFEQFTLCGNLSQPCQLSCTNAVNNGWVQSTSDDIDWRVISGPTSSGGTGPNLDHNPGTANGKYIYTEASGCGLNTAVLLSPCFDLSALSAPFLEFYYHMYGANMGSLAVDISDDDGNTWTNLWMLSGQQQTSNAAPWRLASISLSAYTGSTVIIRIAGTTGNGFASDIAFDDLKIYDNNAPDAGVFSIDSLNSKCSFTSSELIYVQIANFSGIVASNIPVAYSINGMPAINEVYAGPLAPGTSVNYVFATTADLSANGNYSITAYAGLINDGNRFNDSTTIVVTNIPSISTYPYFTGWESGTDGWTSVGTSNSWERGVPANNIISSAAEGSFAWVTDLNGNYNDNELSYLISPCFDLSSVGSDPAVRFSMIFAIENNFDRCWVEYSFDGGDSWNLLGSSGSGLNWYNNSGYWDGNSAGWRTREHIIAGAAGQGNVRIRFVLDTDFTSTREGIGVDALEIIPPIENDGELELVEEYTIIPHKQAAIINRYKVRNKGIFTLQNIAIQIDIENQVGTIVFQDTLTIDSLEAAQSVMLSSIKPFKANFFASHRIRAVLSSAIDDFSGNDSIDTQVSITKSEYARDDGNLNIGTLGIGASVNDNGELGQNFEIVAPDWISTIKFHLGFPPRGDTIHANIYSCLPDGSPDMYLGKTIDYVITPADELNGVLLELPLENGLTILQPGRYFLSVSEPGTNITLTISDKIYTAGKGFAKWDTNPFGAGVWTGIESFGWENAFYIRGLLSDCGVRPFAVDSILTNETAIGTADGSIDLTVSGGFPPYSFVWSNGSTTEDLQNLNAGIYCVTITDSIGCGVDRCYTLYLGTGMNNLDYASEVKVYPNPANHSFIVDFSDLDNEERNVLVYDMHGKEIIERTSSERKITFESSALKQGIYYIRVYSSTYFFVKQVSIVH